MDKAWENWREERAALYERAPKIQRFIDGAKRTLAIGAIVCSAYAGVVAYQANQIIKSPGFEAVTDLVKSSSRMYTHFDEDPVFMSGMRSYVWSRGKVDKDFQFDTWRFLSDCERFAEHQENLVTKIEALGNITPITSSETLRQPRQYTPSPD
ncbi:hypothetical protein GOV07_04940 [Candidatus Woesearchaeota archaeon]|nr:hypothetical protein [Candidatus Woesearchaeota archaeon]